MKALVYTVQLEPIEEGGYFVTVPALPGCCTEGQTIEEALFMAEDAIRLWVEHLVSRGEAIPVEPAPTAPATIRLHIPTSVAA